MMKNDFINSTPHSNVHISTKYIKMIESVQNQMTTIKGGGAFGDIKGMIQCHVHKLTHTQTHTGLLAPLHLQFQDMICRYFPLDKCKC